MLDLKSAPEDLRDLMRQGTAPPYKERFQQVIAWNDSREREGTKSAPIVLNTTSRTLAKCPHCKKKGHAEKDCWIKHPEKQYCQKCKARGHLKKDCPETTDKPRGKIVSLTQSMKSADETTSWLWNTCSEVHLTNCQDILHDMKYKTGCLSGIGGSETYTHTGTVYFVVKSSEFVFKLEDVVYAPNHGFSLISSSQFREQYKLDNQQKHDGNLNVTLFADSEAVIITGKETERGLPKLDITPLRVKHIYAALKNTEPDISLSQSIAQPVRCRMRFAGRPHLV